MVLHDIHEEPAQPRHTVVLDASPSLTASITWKDPIIPAGTRMWDKSDDATPMHEKGVANAPRLFLYVLI